MISLFSCIKVIIKKILANILAKLNKFDEALLVFNKLINLNPGCVKIRIIKDIGHYYLYI